MAEELKRPRVPEFAPAMQPWDGERRRPVDPGTNRRQQSSRRYRQFAPYGRGYANEDEPMSHEQRIIEMIRGGVQ